MKAHARKARDKKGREELIKAITVIIKDILMEAIVICFSLSS